MRPLLVLALASAAGAADYPASAGYVNDLAGKLPDAVQQALELRLRAYERATSNEVAVAIVQSLQGESVEEYARGIFRRWGLGKAEKNNGVLFLWAPTERQVRIQVGYGLEALLTDRDCAAILSRVTPLLHEERYAEGVQTAIDSILQRLGNGQASPVPTVADEPPANYTVPIAGAALLLAAVALLFMHHHTVRTHQMQEDVPAALAAARDSLKHLSGAAVEAEATLNRLRGDAPPEVWQAFVEPIDAAPGEVQNLGVELGRLEAQRREEYRELKAVSRALRHWTKSLEKLRKVFAGLAALRRNVDESRDYATECIPRLSVSLGQFAAADPDERREALRRAASETFDHARILRARPPVNWLLVRDLLEDANCCIACLEQAYNGAAPPERGKRYWPGSHESSPASDQLMAMLTSYQAAMASPVTMPADVSAPANFDGGSSSFGGDSGGGGASASY
jgi:uncharacterized membrane protein YgcG